MVKMAATLETPEAPMDWESLDLPKAKNSRPRCGDLALYDYWRLHVASKLIKKSLAQTLQTAALTYLGRNWPEHEKRLAIEARQQGKTPEALFLELCEGGDD